MVRADGGTFCRQSQNLKQTTHLTARPTEAAWEVSKANSRLVICYSVWRLDQLGKMVPVFQDLWQGVAIPQTFLHQTGWGRLPGLLQGVQIMCGKAM